MLNTEKLSGANPNYTILLPKFLQNYFPNFTGQNFLLLALILIITYFSLWYLDTFWEKELEVQAANYVQEKLISKFRHLTFEEKTKKGQAINTLVNTDSWIIGDYWENLGRKTLHSSILIIFYFTNIYAGWMSFILLAWIIFIGLITWLLARIIAKNDRKYKAELTRKSLLINRETSQANLIEAMGLTSHYENQVKNLSKKNEKLKFSFNRTLTLGSVLPTTLMFTFPFLVLLVINKFSGLNLLLFWDINWEFSKIIDNYLAYGNYRTSLTRINDFLVLPERNDNLTGIKLSKEIKMIALENVSFKYRHGEKWVIQNYNRTFRAGAINRLSGKNGTGKSTILYLLLGMLTPQKGKIIITTKEEKKYNLHHDINLQNWRAINTAYCSHETLIEGVSTGQKQWISTQKILEQKKSASILIFDEADNALDQEKQVEFQAKLAGLAKEKIVIYVKHEVK